MNIDELISDADPAARALIPGHDSPLARRSFERMLASPRRRHGRRRLRYVLALTTATLTAAATFTIVQITGGLGTPQSTAAVILDRAAAAAGRGGPLVLHKGEYLYTETRSLSDDVVAARRGTFYPEYVFTDQAWQTAAGVGKSIRTINSPVTFLYGTRKAWIRAGKPAFLPRGGRSVTRSLAPPKGVNPEKATLHAPYDAVPLNNLSRLPTNPDLLEYDIKNGKTGVPNVGDVRNTSTPGGIFYVAMILLTEPSVGSSPALRSALFQVMADQPGDKVIGTATTHSGRKGVAILTPPLDPHGTDVFEVIVDQKNGEVMEFDQYNHLGGVDSQWSEFLSIAVVHRIGQIPRN